MTNEDFEFIKKKVNDAHKIAVLMNRIQYVEIWVLKILIMANTINLILVFADKTKRYLIAGWKIVIILYVAYFIMQIWEKILKRDFINRCEWLEDNGIINRNK